MADNVIAGTLYLYIANVLYRIEGDWEIEVGGLQNDEMLTGPDGVHGPSRKFVPPGFSGNIRDSSGLSVKQLQAIANITVQGRFANGKVYTLQGAQAFNVGKINPINSTIPVQFMGTFMDEQVA